MKMDTYMVKCSVLLHKENDMINVFDRSSRSARKSGDGAQSEYKRRETIHLSVCPSK